MDIQIIQNKIYEIRGQRVMLDFDLAMIYGIETRVLKQSVKRNMKRFEGDDFMFQLTKEELSRSQFVTLKTGRGSNFKYMPFAFTELGVAMLSSVLKSEMAIEINRRIMRVFVQTRDYLTQASQHSAELAEFRSRLLLVERDCRENLEAMNDLSEDVRRDFDTVFEAIGALSVKLPEAKKSRQPIGFVTGNKED